MSYVVVGVLGTTLSIAIGYGMFFLWSWRTRRAFADGPTMPSTRRTAYHLPLFIPSSLDSARIEVQSAICATGGRIACVEPTRVCATRGPTLWSWGQVLTVWLEAGQQGSNLLIESMPLLSTTHFDGGEGRRSAEAVAAALSQLP